MEQKFDKSWLALRYMFYRKSLNHLISAVQSLFELYALWTLYILKSYEYKNYLSQVRGSHPGGGEIFRTCPDGIWGPPSLLYNGYRVFPRGKVRPGRDADHSPPSSAEVMEE
jgi:hypothetical protein